jgi:hypothetical protein
MLQNEARSLESALRDVGIKANSSGMQFHLGGQQQNQQNAGKQGGYTHVAAATIEDDADFYNTPAGVLQQYSMSVERGLDIRV